MWKRIYIFSLICLTACLLITGCEKDIAVDLPQPTSKVVVDGYVEPDTNIYIILTRNSAYFALINASTINVFETGANVTISDGFTTETLIEAFKGVYITTGMKGVLGRTYSLHIKTKSDEIVTAITTLQKRVPLDSVWFKIQESLPGNDTLGYVWATLHDPDTLNNCYRWMAMRVGKDSTFIPPFGSVFEDRFVNSTTFDFAYNRGSIFNSTADDDENDEAGFFKKGDSIIVKWCAIDRSTYEFWRDAETQLSNNGSPFATPSVIRSNVVGGLGLFASYSPSYYYLKAK